MDYSRSGKPENKNKGQYSNKYHEDFKSKKDWDSLDMRRPGGTTLLDLQKISHKGYLVEPKIPEGYFDPRFIEDKFLDEEIEAFKEAFIFFDREGDGTISLDDLGLALRSLGFLVTSNEVNDLKNKYDPDGRRDAIDLKDFLSCVIDVSNKVDGPEIIRQCFSMLDKNDTGLIKIDEFKHLMKTLGDPLSNEEVNAILKEIDLYGDGFIRMKDLVNLLNIRR